MSSSNLEQEVELFDLLEPSNLQEPFPFFARLRQAQPVYWSAKYSIWLLSRYKDVKAALQSPAKFSSSVGSEILKRGEQIPQNLRADFDICYRFWYTTPQASDAPKHPEQRNAVMKAFTSSVIEQMQGQISQRVERLIDKLPQKTAFDFVEQFAYPLPSLVIFDLLGLPEEHHKAMREAAAQVVRVPGAVLRTDLEAIRQIAESLRKAEAVLQELIRQRRADPKEDLISRLVQMGKKSSYLSDDEIVTLCNFLLTAGHETTANLLAGSMRHLLQNRSLWDQLLADPNLMGNAVEELLRFISPVLWVVRLAAEDIELDGRILPKGSRVQLGIGAANHDPAEFTDPETLDLRRSNAHSVAFGYGPHFCIGAALARMETQIALSSLLRRTPNITLVSRNFDYQPIHFLRSIKTLQVAI